MKLFVRVIVLLLAGMLQLYASEPEIPIVLIMQRVDVENPSVKSVLDAWVDSLDAWRSMALNVTPKENVVSDDRFSQRRVVLDWFSQSKDVVTTYPPTVMSVESVAGKWVVKTLFATTETATNHVIPLGILRSVFVLNQANKPTQENPLTIVERTWNSTKSGMVEFYYPPGFVFDKERAEGSVKFIESTARLFNVDAPSAVTMVIAPSKDAMADLLGIEYYAFPPAGIAYPEYGLIVSGLNDPYYPHEFTHLVLKDLDRNSHRIIREGVATWIGGSITTDFQTLVANYLRLTPTQSVPSFVRLFTDEEITQDDQYILGAAICNAVAQREGIVGIKRLLAAHSTSEVMLLISRMLDLDPADRQESLIPLLNLAVNVPSTKPEH